MAKISNEVIFSILRTLKKFNPGDSYYENYLSHLNKRGDSFYDIYHFSWEFVIENHPKNILEIGTRTGISLAQLLSAYLDHTVIEKIVCCDLFNDGYISPNLVKSYLDYLGIPQDTINKIEFLVGDSKQTIPKYKQEHPDIRFSYILVDGSHNKNDAKTDLDNVVSMVASNGVIVFDDIGKDGMDLLDVWNNFKQQHLDEFTWTENLNGKGIATAVKK